MISIIVPVYNVARYLPECLDSILTQTEPNWEAILVDDGSTDISGAICDDYAAKDSRFRVIHKENGGAASAKNAGLDAAEGEYVAFIDSDDWVDPDWLEKMLSALESSGADVAECDFTKEYRTYTEPGNTGSYSAGVFSAQEYLGIYLSNWSCSLFWNKVFKRKLTQNIRFRKERRCIDDEFYTYKVLSHAKKIVRIEDALHHYRQRASGAVTSSKNRLQITDDALEILTERYDWVSSRFPKLRKMYLKHDVEIMFYFAQAFDFCDETRLKFRKIAGYYLWQCLRYIPDLLTLRYAFRLRMIDFSKLPSQAETKTNVDISSYYP